jgi:hypothetical protein
LSWLLLLLLLLLLQLWRWWIGVPRVIDLTFAHVALQRSPLEGAVTQEIIFRK